ncbi:major facilitator superfamily domain-containing protein [Aspergillus avenaceus]|uniref:Major facilitator superfamily domain-containing protein n=1 Tax=Aspergillus avenaceus TaxID=36643 RepID=A0A5N6TMV8_ASPAV|nr:major facilitator superfamily domain-containing protein [Aspergillus avenaceus]
MGSDADSGVGVRPPSKQLPNLEVQDNIHEEDTIEYPTGLRFVVVLLAMCVSLILVGLDMNMIATAMPTITSHFQTIADVGWYYSAYRLTSCSLQFLFGKLYHLFSIKFVFLASIVIFEVGSLIAGVAPTSALLVLGRAVSGVGCAGIISGIFTMVVQSFPLHRRPFFTGIAAAVEGVSETVAPILGGALTDSVSWRWCFYINLPLGGLSFILIMAFFQDPQKNHRVNLPWREKLRQLDLLGTSIFVPSITCLLLALQWGGATYGWGNVRIIILFVLTGILLAAFAWQERRKGDNALLPGRIMRRRSLLAGMWFSFCNSSTLSVLGYYIPTYLQVVRGASATMSGILCLPIVVGQSLAILTGSSAVSILGYYAPFMILTAILTPIAAGLLTTLQVKQSLASLLCYQALLGVGGGIGFQGPQIAAQTVLPVKDSPMGIAMVIFAQNFGPAMFVSITQTIFTGELVKRLGTLLPDVNVSSLSTMGLSDLSKSVPSIDISRVVQGYDEALTTAFFLPVGLACASMVGALGMEWKSVKRKGA